MTSTHGVRAMVMRGGTSKGLFFVAGDLPADPDERDDLLMKVMGTPDPRQIDGVGGADPLTSKVAIVDRCSHGVAEVDYLFLQVGVEVAAVSDRQNCGNLLSAIGPFAMERSLLEFPDGMAETRVHMLNTDSVATARFEIAEGAPVYAGSTAISGVPGTAAAVTLEFSDISGGSTGALLPTGRVVDQLAGVPATLIDNGMPVVVMRAADLDVTGYESCADLEGNDDLRGLLEKIRLEAGPMMNLGDVSEATIPKLTMVAPPAGSGDLCTRTFVPHRCHQAIGVLGAVSVATAALIPGSPASEVLRHAAGSSVVTLEHPSGTFEAVVELSMDSGAPVVVRSGIVRTARKLMDGLVYPRSY